MSESDDIFKQFDKNDNDTIEWEEFCQMIDNLEENITLNHKAKLFDEIDTNHTGMISYSDFRKWWSERSL